MLNPSVDLTEHVADLKAKGDEDSLRRVFWLTSKTAKIKLGAVNEGELSLLRLKAMDAVFSSQLALTGGIVAGGGVALGNCMFTNPTVVQNILNFALNSIYTQIMINSGVDENKKLPTELRTNGIEEGYNAKTGKIVNMFDAGIVDSAIVQKNAIKNAIHIALRAITTNTFIDLPKRTTEDLQLEILGKQRMNF